MNNHIILTITNNRPADFDGNKSIELFNCIERAYNFDEMVDPLVDIKSNFSPYKNVCRKIASGCSIKINDINFQIIGKQFSQISRAYFDLLGVYDLTFGIEFTLKETDSLSGSSFFKPCIAVINAEQFQSTIVSYKNNLILNIDTIISIKNMPNDCQLMVAINYEKY